MLCDGRSVREVINASGRLFQPTKTNETTTFLAFRPPTISYSLPPKSPLHVLVLDRSSATSESDLGAVSRNWESLQRALFLYIGRLPVGSRLSIISYGSSDAQVNLPPTLVSEENREGLHGRIPRRPITHEYDDASACLDCALKMAFKAMRQGEGQEREVVGTILLATRSASEELSVSEEHLQTVHRASVPVFQVALMAADGKMMPHNASSQQLTQFGGSYVVKPEDAFNNASFETPANTPRYVTRLSEVLSTIQRQASTSELVSFHKDQRVPNMDNVIAGNFVVEEQLSSDLWIALAADDERDIEYFEVVSPTGATHSFPSFEKGLAYFHLAGANEPGIWSFSVRLYQTLASLYPVYLEVLGAPAHKDAIKVDAWVRKEEEQLGGAVQLYASVRQGSLPVLDASVVATVTRPGDGQRRRVELRDLGTGYPDVTRGDGIYSAYFTDFSPDSSGHYTVEVAASHHGGAARTPKLSPSADSNETACCGSALPAAYTIPTGPFRRFVVAESFYHEQPDAFYVRQGSGSVDRFPPSRITDLALSGALADSLFVTLRWTAPGGDLDQGRAFRYEIRCYTNREALRDENFSEMSIPVHATLIPDPEENGTEQRCTVGVPWPNEVFYYAIVAFDEAGNRGKISNTIAVYIKEEPAASEESTGSEDGNVASDSSPLEVPLSVGTGQGSSRQVAFIATGVVAGVLVVLVLLFVAAIRRHHRFVSRALKDSESGSETGESSLDGQVPTKLTDTLRKIMAPVPAELNDSKVWGGHHSAGGTTTASASSGGSSPTSDYSSQKSPLPSISETLSWKYRHGMQKATSQELPGIHRIHHDVTSDTSSVVVEPKHPQPQQPQPADFHLAPRISVLEDFSVYRDLSHLSYNQQDYFSFSQLPADVRAHASAVLSSARAQKEAEEEESNVITVPAPTQASFYSSGTLESTKKRHESLV